MLHCIVNLNANQELKSGFGKSTSYGRHFSYGYKPDSISLLFKRWQFSTPDSHFCPQYCLRKVINLLRDKAAITIDKAAAQVTRLRVATQFFERSGQRLVSSPSRPQGSSCGRSLHHGCDKCQRQSRSTKGNLPTKKSSPMCTTFDFVK